MSVADSHGPSRVSAWLTLMRVSNLPTVWTNALVGFYAGVTAVASTRPVPVHEGLPLLGALLNEGFVLLVALSMIYIGGMILNDVFDVSWDRSNRADRPLITGQISVLSASVAGGLLLLLALLMLFAYIQTRVLVLGTMLAVTVVLYDWLHKRSPVAAALMGACRSLVYLTAGAMLYVAGEVLRPYLIPPALLMGVYVMGVTLLAQRETSVSLGVRRWLAPLLVVWPVLALIVVRPTDLGWWWAGVAGAVMVAWLTYAMLQALRCPPRMSAAVPAWLAGIALIDAWYLTLLGKPIAALAAGLCFVVTVAAQRWIVAT